MVFFNPRAQGTTEGWRLQQGGFDAVHHAVGDGLLFGHAVVPDGRPFTPDPIWKTPAKPVGLAMSGSTAQPMNSGSRIGHYGRQTLDPCPAKMEESYAGRCHRVRRQWDSSTARSCCLWRRSMYTQRRQEPESLPPKCGLVLSGGVFCMAEKGTSRKGSPARGLPNARHHF